MMLQYSCDPDITNSKNETALSMLLCAPLANETYELKHDQWDQIVITLLKYTMSAQSKEDRLKILQNTCNIALINAKDGGKGQIERLVTPDKLSYWASFGAET